MPSCSPRPPRPAGPVLAPIRSLTCTRTYILSHPTVAAIPTTAAPPTVAGPTAAVAAGGGARARANGELMEGRGGAPRPRHVQGWARGGCGTCRRRRQDVKGGRSSAHTHARSHSTDLQPSHSIVAAPAPAPARRAAPRAAGPTARPASNAAARRVSEEREREREKERERERSDETLRIHACVNLGRSSPAEMGEPGRPPAPDQPSSSSDPLPRTR